MKILGTGLSGLVGSRVVEILSSHSFVNLSLETGVDITNQPLVDKFISSFEGSWVFHFAAFTDVDASEKEKLLGEHSISWKTNVVATEYIAAACKKYNKHLVYLSTDYVFDGKSESYTETDAPNPLSWYAVTKYEGEKRIDPLKELGVIVRIANPYRAINEKKLDFVHKIIEKLENKNVLYSPSDQIFIPTFIDDIAHTLEMIISHSLFGIYHVVGGQSLSPYEAAIKIAQSYGLDSSLVRKTTFEDYFQNRAPRPFHAVIKNDKITKFGIHMSTFDEGLLKIQRQHI